MEKTKQKKSAFDIIMSLIMTVVCVVVGILIIQNLTAEPDEGLAINRGTSSISGTVNVSVETAERGTFATYTRLFGDIVTESDPVGLYSDVGGRITEVLVKKGDTINVGDIVAYVDQSRPGYSYQPSAVKSTVDGEVTEVSVAVGDTVTTATSLMSVRFDNELKISTTVPERYISALEIGDTSSFTVTAYSDRTYTADLSYIAPVVDTATRTLAIELDINDQEGLLEGMFATVSLETGREDDVFTVPTDAISTDNGGTYVLIVENGVAVKRHIGTGASDGRRTVVISGLEGGEAVITSGSASENGAVNIVG